MHIAHKLFEPLFHARVCHYSVRTVAARLVLEILVIAAFAITTSHTIAQASPVVPVPSSTKILKDISTTNTASATPKTVASPTPVTQTSTVRAAAEPAPSIPMCAKGTLPNPSPAPLAAHQTGIIKVIDAPNYYTVYGTSLAQAKSQIRQCSPIENGRYAAVTTSTINWSFSYYQDPLTALCKINRVAVGVHTSFLYPLWNTQNTTWRTFIKNVAIHEQGHADLDAATAAVILVDLQTYPPSECTTLTQAANAQAQARITALRQANEAYDIRTNHGTTQGAAF